MTMKPEVTITFCALCNWTLRSGWTAQELLARFGEDLGAVVWDRKADGGFPSAKELKRWIRDKAWPERDLGHIDG